MAFPDHVFALILGQSNAVAGGNGVDFLEVVHPGLAAPYPGVRYLEKIGDSSSNPAWTSRDVPLQPRTVGSHGFGVEIMLGRALARRIGPGRVTVGKFAINGSGLNGNWKKGASPVAGESVNFYDQTLANVAAWEALIGASLTDVVWIQGNNDSNSSSNANNYRANLEQFVADLRADTGRSFRFVFDQLPKGVVTPFVDLVRLRQAEAQIPNSKMVNTDRLTLRDADHYDSESFLSLGELFAEAILENGRKMATLYSLA